MLKIPSKLFALITAALAAVCIALVPAPVMAQNAQCTVNGQPGVRVSIAINGQNCIPVGSNLQNNAVFLVLIAFAQFLFVGVGIMVTAGIVFGSYLYITARANAAQAEKGRNVIFGAVVVLIIYIFSAAIINFLIGRNLFS